MCGACAVPVTVCLLMCLLVPVLSLTLLSEPHTLPHKHNTQHTFIHRPYGFMDVFDSQHVSNGSDDGARYTYEAQVRGSVRERDAEV